ncbi:MAG: hypothetical protein MH252_02910 [Thermosynechococcaceae cyanobacterium MS004]|nr:hypothetical protein [Thermosynechococcaceae cyanobacterium MS004]
MRWRSVGKAIALTPAVPSSASAPAKSNLGAEVNVSCRFTNSVRIFTEGLEV